MGLNRPERTRFGIMEAILSGGICKAYLRPPSASGFRWTKAVQLASANHQNKCYLSNYAYGQGGWLRKTERKTRTSDIESNDACRTTLFVLLSCKTE